MDIDDKWIMVSTFHISLLASFSFSCAYYQSRMPLFQNSVNSYLSFQKLCTSLCNSNSLSQIRGLTEKALAMLFPFFSISFIHSYQLTTFLFIFSISNNLFFHLPSLMYPYLFFQNLQPTLQHLLHIPSDFQESTPAFSNI